MNRKINLRVINRDMLKYFAAAVMFIGHFLTYTIPELHLLGIPVPIARMLVYLQYSAPPIFFFFIAEGFHYTRSKGRYALRLFIFAVITQVPFVLCHALTFDVKMFFTGWNVIMTLFLGLMVLIIWECRLPLPARLLLIAACGAVSFLLNTEWRIVGLLIILAFHLLRERPFIRLIAYELIITGYILVTPLNFGYILETALPILLITFFYNGGKGRFPTFSKCFFYIFYPAHLLFIFFVRILAG